MCQASITESEAIPGRCPQTLQITTLHRLTWFYNISRRVSDDKVASIKVLHCELHSAQSLDDSDLMGQVEVVALPLEGVVGLLLQDYDYITRLNSRLYNKTKLISALKVTRLTSLITSQMQWTFTVFYAK